MIEALLQAERLLVHGMVEQAEQIYRRTLESDPRNAIAVVGLARVALERADDRLAYGHACAALAIDPQNPAALRLEARLSEVLAARGEPVERPEWLRSDGGTSTAALAAAPDAAPPRRESESVALARNPSMADHRARNEAPPEHGEPGQTADPPAPRAEPDRASSVRRRRRRPKGILRRLFGSD